MSYVIAINKLQDKTLCIQKTKIVNFIISVLKNCRGGGNAAAMHWHWESIIFLTWFIGWLGPFEL